ncbi:kelch repeat-containing protein [Caballeronia sp. ATUFL_M2_KS44]|uniref:Kelch repeat-containing protein n=1 Tax=Caballeronia sp. ATUFL_M2_KS44 TaxID=2921767 RepID=UPI002028149F|nr:kelch repeat-containing protein [Caballeronia sp. ATUFL_M2_KS44]
MAASAGLYTLLRGARAAGMPGTMPTPEEMEAIQRGGLYSALRDPAATQLPPDVYAQRFTYSPAAAASDQGHWTTAPPLPLPRSEMAWATSEGDRMHVIGGYGAGDVARPYHHVFDAARNQWLEAAPLPRGANHVGVAALDGVVYAFGGFVEQNRIAVPDCYAYVVADNRWHAIRPLSRGSRGAISVVAHDGLLHAIGGRDTRSVDWHEAYDPRRDNWTTLAPVPGPRDHSAAVSLAGRIHVAGGRMDTFDFNTGMHVAYDVKTDAWQECAPMPTPRSGHGGVAWRGKLFCMGGEGTRRVFGQNEAYDPASDAWQAYAPMLTPRHGMGAAIVGDAIHVAGGGPMNGGRFQTSVHEVFAM